MKRLLSTVLAVVMTLSLCACAQSAAATWQEKYDLGVKYLSEGNYEEAIIAFNAAIEIDPKQSVIYSGRGQAYILSGETQENLAAALADFEQAISLDETLAEGWLGLADVYIRMGEYDKAEEILKAALDVVSDTESLRDVLTEVKDLQGNVSAENNMARVDRVDQRDGTYWLFAYNSAGELEQKTFYWPDGKYCVTEYDNTFDVERYSSSFKPFPDTEYTYCVTGVPWRQTWYAADGTLEDYEITTYDSSGEEQYTTLYSADGQIEAYYTYEEDEDGNVIRMNEYDAEGNLSCYYIYSDEREMVYDAAGNLIDQEEY